MSRIERDVVVIGAGATGLTAALRLHEAGRTVAVLEARDRVGGRLETREIEGQMLELGGQWVSPDQTALLETLDELGLTTYSRYRDGESVYIGSDGRARRFTGDIFPGGASTEAEIARLIDVLDRLVAETDPAAPWAHPLAADYDRISFSAWLEQQTDDGEARANIALFVADAMLTKPAHSFSLLQALLMAASAGSFSHLVDADFILDKRVLGGLQRVPELLAERLGAERVLLEQAVRSVHWSEDGVEVRTDDAVVVARHAIVAVPPNLVGRIRFDPPLPRLRQQALQHQSLGLVIKVHATYEAPFWRADGLSGTAFSPHALVHEAYDNSNAGEERGTLVGFVSDEKADRLLALPEAERKAAILDSLAAYYGPAALAPVVYYESDWAAEEWTQGAYAASFDLGGLTRYGALQLEPVGPLRFGSSDLAAEGYQHVDGAIRVGRRLAQEILDEHAAAPPPRRSTSRMSTHYAVIDPASGTTLSEYPSITDLELTEAIGAAHDAYSTWSRTVPVATRAALIARVADLHVERADALAEIIVREMGKPLDQAQGEVGFAADIYRYYADNGEAFLADEPIELSDGTGSAFVRRAGLGVLLGIMPWNFPYYQVARFAGPNIVAGNTILLKHAPQCPESAAAIADIFATAAGELGAPAGVYVNLYASNDQAADVIADPRVQGVSVTGSERAGAAVAEIAGRNLKKVVLELGGSDPFVLLSTDDLDKAVEDAVAARLDNNGQSCNAAKRFIVIDDLYEEFASKFTAAFTKAQPADPFAEGTLLGPLSSSAATERLEQQLATAREQGATVRASGEVTGNFFPPAVLEDVTPDMNAYREEFFGPVAALYRVHDEDEAIALANDTPYGLGSYLYTTDQEQALRLADRIDAGMVWINLVLGDAAELPFGGVKRSGTGREMGRSALEEFVNKKLIRIA